MFYPIIMAGGTGTRFWPASTQKIPKQYLTLIDGNSLIGETYKRLSEFSETSEIFTISGKDSRELILEKIPAHIPQNIIEEPCGRNTAPAVMLMASIIYNKNPDAVIGFFPSDAYISPITRFHEILRTGVEFAGNSDSIVTLGVKPDKPHTGYGYIQKNQQISSGINPVYSVKEFCEKPDLEKATEYFQSGEYYFNAGIFLGKAKVFLDNFQKLCPEIYDTLKEFGSFYQKIELFESKLTKIYPEVPKISIDYAIMEKSSSVCMIPLDCFWSDLGDFHALFKLLQQSENQNVIQGNSLAINCKNTMIYQTESEKRPIITYGLDNVIVVSSSDGILVIPQEMTSSMGEVYQKVKEHFPERT